MDSSFFSNGGRMLLGQLVELVNEVVKVIVAALVDFVEAIAWHLTDKPI